MNRINKPLLLIAIAFIAALLIYIGIAFLTKPKEDGQQGKKDVEQSTDSETDASKGNKDAKDAGAKGEQAGAKGEQAGTGPEAGKETEGAGKQRADAKDESDGAGTKGGADAEDESAETGADGTSKKAGEAPASEAAEAFMRMSDAASAEGVTVKVVSGYRDKVYQEGLYNTYAANNGVQEADTYSARPRHSEHETGLCCDINDVNASFEYTQAFQWLQQNGAEYGYILRYPKGKEGITGYIYEPWHWRYVGKETAIAVKNSGLTYDEYYHQYIEN